MISRIRRASAVAALLVGSVLLTVACQKVPLLAPSGSTITLTAAATALPANGSTDIIAQVIEAGGTPPHSGTLVTFTTNLGSVRPPEAETDISGRVTVRYLAGSGSGTATITAISGGVSASGTNAIKIAVGAAAVGGIALSASLTTLPASGGTTTISAAVNDGGGNSLASVPVTFSTDNGSLGTSVVITDANGRAATTLTTSRTAKVTATAGVATTSGTTTTAASTNSITITVNASATVAFGTFSPTAPVAGQTVSFTLTITPSATGGAIQGVVVNFGDGQTQTLGAVSGATSLSHTYRSSGTYTLTAMATDSNGDAFPAVATLTVGARPPASVTIVTTPSTGIQVGQQVAFTVTTSFQGVTPAPVVQSVTLDFGDGKQANLGAQSPATAQHVYQTAGTYTVTAVVTDTNGGSSSSQTQVIVGNRTPPTAGITASPNDTIVGATVTLTITASAAAPASVRNVHVDFADGSGIDLGSGTSFAVPHKYQVAQTYTPSATVTDTNGSTATASTQVIVSSFTASFTVSPASPTRGTSATFDGSGSTSTNTITTYSWNFGDGLATGTGITTTHTYASAGTFSATLTITDSGSRTTSTTKQITVQ